MMTTINDAEFLTMFITDDGTIETSLVFDATCFIERTDEMGMMIYWKL